MSDIDAAKEFPQWLAAQLAQSQRELAEARRELKELRESIDWEPPQIKPQIVGEFTAKVEYMGALPPSPIEFDDEQCSSCDSLRAQLTDHKEALRLCEYALKVILGVCEDTPEARANRPAWMSEALAAIAKATKGNACE